MKKSAVRFLCIVFTMFLLLSQGVTAAPQSYPGEFEFTLAYDDNSPVWPGIEVANVVLPKLKFDVADGKMYGTIDNGITLPDYLIHTEIVEESADGSGTYSKTTGQFEGNFDCSVTFISDSVTNSTLTQHLVGTFYGGIVDGSLAISCVATVDFVGSGYPPTQLERANITRSPVFLVDSTVRFNSLSGQVEIGRNQDETTPCTLKTVINVGDYIVTGKNSSCIIRFADMSTFVLQENSVIRIAAPPAKETKLEFVAGRIWANTKRVFTGDGQLNIEMGQAVAGIKGTTYVCEENNGVSTLKVLDGVVEFTANADNSVATVKKGEKISADANGLSPVTSFNLAEEEAAWAEFTASIREQESSDSQDDQDKKETRPRQQDAGRGTFNILAVILIYVFISCVTAVIVVLVKRKKP